MRSHCFFTIALTVLIGMANTPAKNYYVSSSGDDTHDGSFSSPWRHIAFATCGGSPNCSCSTPNANKINAGDTLFIRGGTYHEHNIQLANTGVRGRNGRITIKSYPGEWAIIDADSVHGPVDLSCAIGLGVNYANNFIMFDSLQVQNGYSSNFFIGFNYPDTGILIQNCVIKNHIYKAGDNCCGVAFARWGAVDDTVRNCIITGNDYNYQNYCGVQIMYADGINVENCEISHVYAGIFWKHTNISKVRLSRFINNFIHNNVGFGIGVCRDRVLIKNNLIINMALEGIWFWRDAGADNGGCLNRAEHNTLYNNHYGIVFYWGSKHDSLGFTVVQGSSYDTTYDNIISATSAEFGSYAVWPYTYDSVFNYSPNLKSDYNLYWNTATSNVMDSGRTPMTFNAWKLLYPDCDMHSVWGLPKFANTSGAMNAIEDFKLLPSSPGYRASSDFKDMGSDVDSVGVQAGQVTAIKEPAKATCKAFPHSAASPYCSIILADRRSSLVSGERLFDIRGRQLRGDRVQQDGIVIGVKP